MKTNPWIVPMVAAAMLLVPLLLPTRFALAVVAFIGFYTLGTLGLQVLMGYAGQISVGHAAFFGIGAYAYGGFTTRLGLPTLLALLAAALLNAGLAWAIGRPVFRLKGPQLALATLVLGIIASTVFAQADRLTGGALGMGEIPPLSLAGFAINDDFRNAYLAITVALVVLLLTSNVMRSRPGRSLRALSAEETVAASLGIDTGRHKLAVFVASAVLTGLGGSLYAAYLTYISPDAFTFLLSVELLLMSVLGGMGSVWGAPVGAATVVLLMQLLDFLSRRLPAGSDVILKSISFGACLMLVIMFLPNGLASLGRRKRPPGQG